MKHKINTRRLVLTPFLIDDFNIFHQLNIDPHIREFMWDGEEIALDTSKEIMQKNGSHFERDNFGIWKVILKETDELIGYTGLWYFFDEEQPQLIYAILKKFTKQGYAHESSKAIIRYSFETLDFKYLIAATDESHLESQKVAKGLGMKYHEKRMENDKPTLFFRIEKGALT
ncbi:MAG: GNAT family N-acetyltransferase [Bacteroidota bacterium]